MIILLKGPWNETSYMKFTFISILQVAVFLHVIITTTEILYPVVVILRYVRTTKNSFISQIC